MCTEPALQDSYSELAAGKLTLKSISAHLDSHPLKVASLIIYCEVFKSGIWPIFGDRLDAIVSARSSTLIHLARADNLTIARLQNKIWVAIFVILLLESLWLRCILTHTFDAVLGSLLCLIALRGQNDLAIRSDQAEVEFSILVRFEELELAEALLLFLGRLGYLIIIYREIFKSCRWRILGNRSDAVVPACCTTFIHLARADNLTIARLQNKIWVAIFVILLLESLWLRCILTHTFDAVLRS
mmetsp:Transcript_2911/g.5111  ORF Transcript_2911/g.5111 Transcript_2911/m.5111 type:complete len:243 (+) Transcript_2911:101-829(+)